MRGELKTKISCPSCSRELSVVWRQESLPYFGDVMMVSALCECGFRIADTMLLESKGPMRCVLKLTSQDDLNIRVVRSSSCTVLLPELGVKIEPGAHCEAFVSNVEGVLSRVESVLVASERWSTQESDEDRAERCRQLLRTIERIRSGEEDMTLVLEDPMGNSAIVSPRAVCEPL
ncbi:MAG: ZPR1 zinc finger domain-containing protein [Methermicoccaceae archaeon]